MDIDTGRTNFVKVAIVTKVLPDTYARGKRIKAYTETGHNITIPFHQEGEESLEDVYRKAAQALCGKLNWTGEMIAGSVKDGYVFVFTGKE